MSTNSPAQTRGLRISHLPSVQGTPSPIMSPFIRDGSTTTPISKSTSASLPNSRVPSAAPKTSKLYQPSSPFINPNRISTSLSMHRPSPLDASQKNSPPIKDLLEESQNQSQQQQPPSTSLSPSPLVPLTATESSQPTTTPTNTTPPPTSATTQQQPNVETDSQLPPMPLKPMASPMELLSQSLQVLSEIKGLVYPSPSSFMPEEVNVALLGECVGLSDLLAKMGMKAIRLIDAEAASKVKNAKPPFHLAFCDCTSPTKIPPPAFVTSIMSSSTPIPIILTQTFAKTQQHHVQSCLQAGAQGLITLPTTPEAIKICISDCFKFQFIAKSLQQNVSAHAQLLSHLSKILMEQDLYLRSLSEHLALLEKYKKQSERLIVTLQSEVSELHRVNQLNQQQGEKLKLENVAMKWKRAFDAASRSKKPSKQSNVVLEVATEAMARSGLIDSKDKATAQVVAAVARAESAKIQDGESRQHSPPQQTGNSLSPIQQQQSQPQSPTTPQPPTSDGGGNPDDVFLGPLQMITHIVRRLAKIDQFLDKEDLKNVLLSVVKALASKEWYGVPETKNLDGQTQLWVDSTFRNICPDAATRTTGQESLPTTLQPDEQQTQAQETMTDPAKLLDEIALSVNKEQLYSWEFSAPKLSHEELAKAVVIMWGELNLFQEFQIPVQELVRFLSVVESNYHTNPYHSFIHACDVSQVCFLFLKKTKLRSLLLPIDSLTLMLGALCHDLDHPGLNNVFQINARTQLAILYNDVSVLENHHASLANRLITSEECKILHTRNPSQISDFRRSLISEILATDMVKHFELVSRFQSHLETGPFSQDKKEDRQLLLDIILHSADISNLTRPEDVSKIWSDLLFEEYLHQGDEEKRVGLPISPYMNRDDTDQIKMSINFIDFIGLPLFTAIAKAFPEIQCCVEKLRENKKTWEIIRSKQPPKPLSSSHSTPTIKPIQSSTSQQQIAVIPPSPIDKPKT